MKPENHNAYPMCNTRAEKVACIAEAMRRLGEGCTAEDLKNCLGITDAQLKEVVDDARAEATARSIRQTRSRVPVARAA